MRKRARRSRKRLPTLPALKRKAWDLLSKWVRMKDADSAGYATCYTCGRTAHWTEMQAGHFVSGRTGSVLLCEDLCRAQCARCNIFLHGNYQSFTLRMLDEVGRHEVDELLDRKHRTVKWNRSQLNEFISLYRSKLDALHLTLGEWEPPVLSKGDFGEDVRVYFEAQRQRLLKDCK